MLMKRISTHRTSGGYCFHYVTDIIPRARWVDSDGRAWFGIGKYICWEIYNGWR